MKKFFTKLALYGSALFISSNCIAYLCLLSLEKSNFYKPQFVKNGVPTTSFDYVVLGSSTGLTTLNTIAIDSISGKKGLNISMDDSALNSHYLMLQHFLALNKTSKKLILAITPWDLANATPKLNNNDYRFLPFVSEGYVSDYYLSFETDVFKPLAYSKYFPILGISCYNTELFYPALLTALKPNKRNRFDEKGNYSYPSLGGIEETKKETIQLDFKNPYYFKIKALCEKHQMELITYISPIYNTKVIANQSLNLINHSDFIQDKTLFYDGIHVNELGRKKCSFAMASVLIN